MSQHVLPTEKIAPTSRRRLAQTLLLTVGLVVVFNLACVWYLDRYQPNQSGAIIAGKWSLIDEAGDVNDWLIVGDSTGNQGVVPELFRDFLNESAINLCTLADMGTVDDAWMLHCYIREHGAPKNILIVHAFDCWQKPVPSIGLMAYAPFEKIRREAYAPTIRFGLAESAVMYAYRYVPLYFQNLSLTELIKHPSKLFRTIPFSDGFLATRYEARLEQQFEVDKSRCLNFVRQQSFSVSSRNQESLATMINTARLHGIRVFLSCGPICNSVANDENFQRYYQQLHRYMDSVSKPHEHVFVVTPDSNAFDRGLFEGTAIDHVTEDGARQFTKRVIAKIKSVAPVLKQLR